MWLVTDRGFVSLVVDRKDRNMLQVRARVASDITENFPNAKVFVSNGGDYRYRARVRRAEVAIALAEQVMDMDYDSHFKDVALTRSKGSSERRAAYYGTWTAMAKMQDYAPYSKVSRADAAAAAKVRPWTGGAANTGISGGLNFKKRESGGGYERVYDTYDRTYDTYDDYLTARYGLGDDDARYSGSAYSGQHKRTEGGKVNTYPGADRWSADAKDLADPFADWEFPGESADDKIIEDLFTDTGVEPTDAELREIERTMGVDLRNMDDDTREIVLEHILEAKRELEALDREKKAERKAGPEVKTLHSGRRPGRTGSRSRRNRRRR